MSAPRLRQARQLLIQQGLVAYRRPLYQVLALEAQERVESARPF